MCTASKLFSDTFLFSYRPSKGGGVRKPEYSRKYGLPMEFGAHTGNYRKLPFSLPTAKRPIGTRPTPIS